MKKKEWMIILALVVVCGGLFLFQKWRMHQQSNSGVTIEVYYRDKVIYEMHSGKDETYTVHGDYGTLDVQVQDGKWRVTNEQCPNHICAKVGWVAPGEFIPITCIPNNVVVMQKGD